MGWRRGMVCGVGWGSGAGGSTAVTEMVTRSLPAAERAVDALDSEKIHCPFLGAPIQVSGKYRKMQSASRFHGHQRQGNLAGCGFRMEGERG